MTLSRVHASAEAEDVAKLLLKKRFYLPVPSVVRAPTNRNHNPNGMV